MRNAIDDEAAAQRTTICVLASAHQSASGEALAQRLGVALVHDESDCAPYALVLRCDESGLTLVGGNIELQPDLTRLAPRLAPHRLSRELLVRAAKLKGEKSLRAIDATCGLGEDTVLLAAAGFHVQAFEANPVIAALLEDALRRAADDAVLGPVVARITLAQADSIQTLAHFAGMANVVYLDPMFPARTKSAAVKKKFQLLHQLETPCANPAELLAAARAVQPRKIVIKRPLKGPHLAGVKPSYTLAGKTVRYDCLVFA